MYTNIESLIGLNRRLNLQDLANKHDASIICLTETCLSSDSEDSELFSGSQFSVVTRVDRKCGYHGGVLIAARNKAMFFLVELKNSIDYIASSILTTSNCCFLMIVAYNSPASSRYRISVTELVHQLSALIAKFHEFWRSTSSSILCLADFNLPDVCWDSLYSTNDYSSKFLNALDQEIFLKL